MTAEEIERMNVMLSPEVPHRAIFPHTTYGPNRFWAGRAVIQIRPPWLFPRRGETALTKGQVVWGLEEVEQSHENIVWICEGIFDAIATKGVCVFGKKPTALQLRTIMSLKPKTVIIAFDRDAREEAEDVQRRLRMFVPTKVRLPSNGQDYGEYLKRGQRRHLYDQEFA